MIEELHKRENTAVIDFEPNEGERTLLCSNKGGIRSPSLDLDTPLIDGDLLVAFFELLIKIESRNNSKRNSKTYESNHCS